MIKNEKNQIECEMQDAWDILCSEIGFDEKGLEIQKMIKKFIELKDK